MTLLVDHGADSAVHVLVEEVDARVEDNVTYEIRNVKVGERQEWDDKKKKMVTKDVYKDRSVPVHVHTAHGHVAAHVEVEAPGGAPRNADAGAAYDDEFKGDVRIPEQASSESSLEHYLGHPRRLGTPIGDSHDSGPSIFDSEIRA
jgi:hypothetical protein